MTKLSLMKKTDLVSLATELGVSTEGFKSDIENRILLFLQNNPSYGNSPKYSSYLSSSPNKRRTTPSSGPNGSTIGDFVLKTPQSFASTPLKNLLGVNQASTNENTEEEEEEEEEEDDDEGKKTSEQGVDEGEEEEEEEEGERVTFIDKAKEWTTNTQSQILEILTSSTEFVVGVSDDARVKLSNVHLLNALSVVLEFGILLNSGPLWKSIPRYDELVEVFSPLLVWLLTSLIAPLVLSYYVNFTVPKPESVPDAPARRTRSAAASAVAASRVPPEYSLFDPLVFVLSRTVIAYVGYFHTIDVLLPTAVQDLLGPLVSILHQSSRVISTILGDVPFVTGATVIVVVIYAATL